MNRNNHPRLIARFRQIPYLQKQIKMGLVHEIFVNTDHSEEYLGFIPNPCSDRIKAYTNRYQAVFYFKVWSIWKERKYLKLFSSTQIWELHLNNPFTAHGFDPYQSQNFVLEEEAASFFKESVGESLSGAHYFTKGKTILLFYSLSAFEHFEERLLKVNRFLDHLNLGRIGTKARLEFDHDMMIKDGEDAHQDDNNGLDALEIE